jgi:CBS domain-containing protein
MGIGEICIREVTVMGPDESVRTAAELMERHSVGNVIILEEGVPSGILTDRDIAIRVVARGLDTEKTTTRDVMSRKLATVKEGAGVGDSIRLMLSARARRLPVLREDGTLAGIVTLDDLLDLLAEEANALVKIVRSQQQRGRDTET